MFVLPKELRLKIWALAYHDEASRLPRPTTVNTCQESRAEARYQALKAGDLIQASADDSSGPPDIYCRAKVDVLYITEKTTFSDDPWILHQHISRTDSHQNLFCLAVDLKLFDCWSFYRMFLNMVPRISHAVVVAKNITDCEMGGEIDFLNARFKDMNDGFLNFNEESPFPKEMEMATRKGSKLKLATGSPL
ncbi:hypothetical protein BDV95DRAFT_611183 [Massariosphaeria phaeospora]|uniref:Uncharacterized protein n=1 Tax=Massariosphaeria phaeospora TaxID=100035 RepID=A0A7C8I758_9PLEO|nr:hypothetical protein BDV95DRAFT_611183 [Massariosphaeria phaeospora]